MEKHTNSIFPFIQHCILSICTLPIPLDAYSEIAHFLYPTSTSIPSKRERNVKYLIKMRWLKNGKLLCFSFSFSSLLSSCCSLSVIDFCAKFTSIHLVSHTAFLLLLCFVEDLVKVWEDEKVCDIIEVLLRIDWHCRF